jgi:hypothetical protein
MAWQPSDLVEARRIASGAMAWRIGRVLLVIGIVTLSPGCASSGSAGSAGSGRSITYEEIQRTGANNAYEIVQQLRPGWLRSRGRISIQDGGAGFPVVYLDSTRYGELATLRQFNVNIIERIDMIDARDATTRYGTGHSGGVILVTTRR